MPSIANKNSRITQREVEALFLLKFPSSVSEWDYSYFELPSSKYFKGYIYDLVRTKKVAKNEYYYSDTYHFCNAQAYAATLLSLTSAILDRTIIRTAKWARRGSCDDYSKAQVEWLRAVAAYNETELFPKQSLLANLMGASVDFFRNNSPVIFELLKSDQKWVKFVLNLPAAAGQAIIQNLLEQFERLAPMRLPLERVLPIVEHFNQYAGCLGIVSQCHFYLNFMVNGDPLKVLTHIDPKSKHGLVLSAVIAMSENQASKNAVNLMKQALLLEGKKRLFQEPILNWFYCIALLRDRENTQSANKLHTILTTQKYSKDSSYAAMLVISHYACLQDTEYLFESILDNLKKPYLFQNAYDYYLALLVGHVFGSLNHLSFEFFEPLFAMFPILELEFHKRSSSNKLTECIEKFKVNPLLPDFHVMPKSERVLERLTLSEEEFAEKNATKQVNSTIRFLYLVDRDSPYIEIKVQKSKNGTSWSKGTNVPYSRFVEGMEGMTEVDKAVSRTIHQSEYSRRMLDMDVPQALLCLVGCPNVVDMQTQASLEIRLDPVQISVMRTKSGYRFTSNLPIDYEPLYGTIAVEYRAAENLITVIHPSDEEISFLKYADELRDLPASAEGKLKKFLNLFARHTPVISDMIDTSSIGIRQAGDSRIVFRIQRTTPTDFDVQAFVQPCADSTVTCIPGKGTPLLAVTTKAGAVQVERDLAKESSNFSKLETALEVVDSCRTQPYAWEMETPECLQLLEVLHDNSKLCVMQWPQGEKFSVSQNRISSNALSLSLHGIGQWFKLEGKVKLNGKSFLSVAEILEKLASAQGNFIELKNNEYVALTDSLKKQLESLKNLATKDRSKDSIRISRFNTSRLETLRADGLDIETDDTFKTLCERIRSADSLVPAIPTTLKAELRDYQVEGFEWMVRLSEWGAGALLADDMGLGKTVQTIAFLLSRMKSGPALVVVPTAVVGNWVDELKRFAPTLNPIVYAKTSADCRVKTIENAKAGDVVLVTYGVLASDIEDFAKAVWATVVLDEAHNIKNRETKMSKAVMQLQAESRVMLTGTPLQNHLGELWNLFEFANPGLLGGYEEFEHRFVIPVEKNRNREAQRTLKRLISPFILRRTKTEVLDELPEKTEITLRVKLSDEEMALYENLRQKASEGLETGEINPIEALAELMRLRQAACSPALVNAAFANIVSSKTGAFLELAQDIIEARHRALVFSQFTSHLALVKKALDEKGIEYLYLDGSMTSAQRIKLVDKFQQGDVPLFLISLKAGGTGLNLTAADYVIHLDPWWNPAIEDQASDRAYRIGQENPVTVYRLIAENTIEEKILTLHETKKSLADALLEGADMSSRLSREEILKLLSS